MTSVHPEKTKNLIKNTFPNMKVEIQPNLNIFPYDGPTIIYYRINCFYTNQRECIELKDFLLKMKLITEDNNMFSPLKFAITNNILELEGYY